MEARIVTGSCKERSDGINRIPRFLRLAVCLQCQSHQKSRPVLCLIILGEISPSIPHHGAEVLLQLLISLVIATGFILGVILHSSGQWGFHNAPGIPDKLLLLFRNGFRISGKVCRILPHQLCAYRKESNIHQCCILPLCSGKLFILLQRIHIHPSAELPGEIREIIHFRIFLQQGKIQMIGVHHGIGGYKNGNLCIAALLI